MTLENPPCSIGNTSSNDGCSIVMLVFGGVHVDDSTLLMLSPYLRIWGMLFLAFVSAQAMVLWPVEGFSKVSPAVLLLVRYWWMMMDVPTLRLHKQSTIWRARIVFLALTRLFFHKATRPKSNYTSQSVKHWFTGDPRSHATFEAVPWYFGRFLEVKC